jgi:hypothetical protein
MWFLPLFLSISICHFIKSKNVQHAGESKLKRKVTRCAVIDSVSWLKLCEMYEINK